MQPRQARSGLDRSPRSWRFVKGFLDAARVTKPLPMRIPKSYLATAQLSPCNFLGKIFEISGTR